jgi:hypothetical protein
MPGCSNVPESAHEWVSFDDDEEERTWVFDVTFLTSNWTCIFGAGCQGVLTGPAPELVQGCCSYGAHFVDHDDVAKIEKIAAELPAKYWQFRDKGVTKKGVVKIARVNKDGDTVTRQAEDACIFLNRPGFETGPGCALHTYAVATGQRPLDLKPDVCWQLPLRREDAEDADGHVTSTVRQWDRSHWGDGGREFHWWCTEADDAFVERRPVYETLRDELVELCNQVVYDKVVAYLASRKATTFLPHPAVRRTSKI